MSKYISLRGLDSKEKLRITAELAWKKFQLHLTLVDDDKQKYKYIDDQMYFVDIYGFLYDILPMHIIKRSESHDFHRFRRNKFAKRNRELLFILNGYKILNNEKYISTQQKVDVVDNDNYLNNVSISDLNRGVPVIFSSNNKYIIKNINTFLVKNDCKSELVSKKYCGTHVELKFKCNECGSVYKSTFANIKRRQSNNSDCSCLDCSYLNNTSYNITLANRNKDELEKMSGNIYLIKMFDKSISEEFYKIGITKNSLDERYNYNNMSNYKYEEILFYKTSMYNAIKIEKILKNELSIKSYIPNNKFGGYTECFIDIDVDNIKRIIKNNENN